jgi:glycine/D-amino acid oxidase-like deaminating enzyme
VLLERKQLTSGTTWHAAGLLTKLRATYNMTMLAAYAEELFKTCEQETGLNSGFRRTGSIIVARTEGRWEEVKRGLSMAKIAGFDVEIIDAAEPSACGRSWTSGIGRRIPAGGRRGGPHRGQLGGRGRVPQRGGHIRAPRSRT